MDLIAYFIFYNKAHGPQSRLAFHPDFKHMNVIVYDGIDWIMFDFGQEGYVLRCIKAPSASALYRSVNIVKTVTAKVAVQIKKRKHHPWRPFLVRSCNELCRYATGIDVGFTFNPIHFYTKLLNFRHKRNYVILKHWRAKDGLFRRRQRTAVKRD